MKILILCSEERYFSQNNISGLKCWLKLCVWWSVINISRANIYWFVFLVSMFCKYLGLDWWCISTNFIISLTSRSVIVATKLHNNKNTFLWPSFYWGWLSIKNTFYEKLRRGAKHLYIKKMIWTAKRRAKDARTGKFYLGYSLVTLCHSTKSLVAQYLRAPDYWADGKRFDSWKKYETFSESLV